VRVDQFRVHLRERLVPQPQVVHRPDGVVLYEDVRVLDQLLQYLLPPFGFEIERDTLLRGVDHHHLGRLSLVDPGSEGLPERGLDLDDVRAEIGEHQRAVRTVVELPEIKNLDTF
jgi:hypothetical protein